ncbi:MAG: formate dehydrogenase subunit gamma [Polyangiaceae bacterium]
MNVKDAPTRGNRVAGGGSQDGAANAAQLEAIERAISDNRHLDGALLPILHAIQDRLGYIPPEAARTIAEALNFTQADVHGVISFYHDFRKAPPGRHVVKLCRAEACQSMGSAKLESHLKGRLGIDFGQTTSDRAITLEPVYCLGNCACSPALMVDGELKGRITPEKVDALIATLREAK